MAGPDHDLAAVLEYVRTTRGFDFTGYKPASIERRVAKRMEAVGATTPEEYLDYLEVHAGEMTQLFNTILINVTSFFRDAETWGYLGEEILPRLLAGKDADSPIRVWSAGCASGEEPYTIALLLAEALGEEEYRRRVKIYATDVDEEALDEARHATYPVKALEPMPDVLRDRYFSRSGERYGFRNDLRRAVIFGRNDLVQDAPISKIDLLVCRNTLMYFNAETQGMILRRFHFALQPAGYLFLGKSEMLLARRELFEPVSLKRRVFRKVVSPEARRAYGAGAPGPDGPAGAVAADAARASFEAAPYAQIVVDRERALAMANARARRLLGLEGDDLGRPLKDLQASYRPAELRAGLDAVFELGQPVQQAAVTYLTAGEQRTFEVRMEPLEVGGELSAASVTFLDVTATRLLEYELERSKRDLGAAYEELQSTVEELETTNEELQSTNEELETTNEELQSTNEELETMNEELQSSNEELETTNDELRERSLELNEANAFMETILQSMGVGVAVVDRDQHVQIWNAHAEELWGARADEAIGTHILALDIGLPLEQLAPVLRAALASPDGPVELAVEATDRRGRAFGCRMTVLPLTVDGRAASVIVLMRRADVEGD